MDKACKNCRLIIAQGELCPVCGGTALTSKWHGYVVILNAEKSEIAKKLEIRVNGTYALSLAE
ncbi:MAG: DNA-directed RNA polymerase, subunit E'' [Candidatus Micrarchaeota archaeon]|nr:DNA-directed RNA polymerase, subunit E'' [Candidatus Micrarchaeota archaeon]MDE1847534.1 DNA-directed RNA polymerase, subunit E'' [Candidatus Micrarchaeota archaeon]MDE1864251.1 DNA-directed RNA polymerase, subunit E'' [Candidatus Micrarchaeota archaeon]